MKKLHEVISKSIGAKFVLLGNELTMERFSLAKMIEYEEEGYNIDDLMNNMIKKPSSWGTRIAYDLLDRESKVVVGESLEDFRKLLSFDDLSTIINAVNEAIVASMPKPKGEPVEKNEQSEAVQS